MRVKLGKITKKAISSYYKYGVENFGFRVASEHIHKLYLRICSLKKYPEIGFPEPLLKDRKKMYRALVFEKRFKIIYSVNYIKEEVFIRDFWDLKKKPSTLAKRIK